jgi:hypothetical protein
VIDSDTNRIFNELIRIGATGQTDIFVEASIIETEGGVVIFIPDRFRLRSILLEWAQDLINDFYSKTVSKIDLNKLTKRETGRKATLEEAAEIENAVKRELSDKVFQHSLNLWQKHLPQRMDDAVLETLELTHLRAFLDWMSEEDTQTSSEAHYFDQLLKTINARIKKRFQKRRRGGSKPRLDNEVRFSLNSRFFTLCLKIKEIKKFYDGELDLFKRNHQKRGFNAKQWSAHWLTYACERFPNEDKDFLISFTDLDHYESSVSGIAYKQLAKETGYAIEYVKKLVGKAKKYRPNPKRTMNPKD